MAQVAWEKSLHDARLETLIKCPSLFDGGSVKHYDRKCICVICDAEADSRDNFTHAKPNCQVEFKQIMLFAWHLQRAA